MNTMGPAFEAKLDGARVLSQMDEIRDRVLGNGWWTLAEIETATGFPQASISAQLRHLRKERFGAYQVERRRRSGAGWWEYQVNAPVEIRDGSQLPLMV
ncbi:MAG: hypothetical protein ACREI9_05725 [Nitrospiraceae bacterium]